MMCGCGAGDLIKLTYRLTCSPPELLIWHPNMQSQLERRRRRRRMRRRRKRRFIDDEQERGRWGGRRRRRRRRRRRCIGK